MFQKTRLISALLLISAFTGCASDPTASLAKRFAGDLAGMKEFEPSCKWGEPDYEVKKTESLTHPRTGTVSLECVDSYESHFDVKIFYALNEKKQQWQPRGYSVDHVVDAGKDQNGSHRTMLVEFTVAYHFANSDKIRLVRVENH